MEPTALQAFRTTSRLLGSECAPDYEEQKRKMLNNLSRVHNKKLLRWQEINTVNVCRFVKQYMPLAKKVRDIWLSDFEISEDAL